MPHDPPPLVPYHLATGYRDQAIAAGDRALLHTVPNTGHVELIAPESSAWAEAKRLLLAALEPVRRIAAR